MESFTSSIFLAQRFFPNNKIVTKPRIDVTVFYDNDSRVVENITIHIGNGVAQSLNWNKFNEWLEKAVTTVLKSTYPLSLPDNDNEPDNEKNDDIELLKDLYSLELLNEHLKQ